MWFVQRISFYQAVRSQLLLSQLQQVYLQIVQGCPPQNKNFRESRGGDDVNSQAKHQAKSSTFVQVPKSQ